MVSQQVTKIDNIDNLVNKQVTKNRTDEEISSYLYKKSADKIINEYVKSNFNSYNSLFNTFLKYLVSPNSNSNSNYTYYGRTKFNVITKTIGLFFKKKLRENFMKDNLSFKTANLEPFVYFPLSVDMERNLLINTPFYTNQIETIRIIAKSIPINYRLCMVPGSDTGAMEIAIWNFLGCKPVDIFEWDYFGKEWKHDIINELNLTNTRIFESKYGDMPNLQLYNPIFSLYFHIFNTKNSHKCIDLKRRYYIYELLNTISFTFLSAIESLIIS